MPIVDQMGSQIDAATMTQPMMETLPANAFARADSADVDSDAPDAMGGMDQQMMTNMPPEAMQGMSPDMMEAMPADAMGGMDAANDDKHAT